MARRRYRRYRRRSGRWAANIQEFNGNLSGPYNSVFFSSETILRNPYQSTSVVSQVYTVKNIEITFNMELEDPEQFIQHVEGLCAYIMYVPQGMTITEHYNTQHPEYIMAYKYVGSPSIDSDGQQYQPIRVRTRLARKLQTGDNIILFVKGTNQNTEITNNVVIRVSGVVRWWTKAN